MCWSCIVVELEVNCVLVRYCYGTTGEQTVSLVLLSDQGQLCYLIMVNLVLSDNGQPCAVY